MHTKSMRARADERIIRPAMAPRSISISTWPALALLLALATAALGCSVPDDEVVVPDADPVVFKDAVYPILLRDCAFTACHGNPDRFLAVFGPGRAAARGHRPRRAGHRRGAGRHLHRTRSMLMSPAGSSARRSCKPLAEADGGVRHRGTDPWGNAIFPSKDDPRFVVLAQWALAGQP
ncbi:MAG: hypothetical protein IPL61_18650 [Myxococcales bacterium]|nr:hypothetical protein [Myxococcales bacterium]